MKLLVTGASGFVGRTLCIALQKRGLPFRSSSRSQTSLVSGGDHVVVNKIDHGTDWSTALAGVDVVIHLAARVHVMQEKAIDPLAEFQEVNLHGTVNLARQAASAGVKRFVYVSTVKVNGEYTEDKPFSESDAPKPQDPYGVSKWQAEQGLDAIGRETGMEIVIIRPPLVYGPGVKANFYSLLKLVSKQVPLPLGSIRNRRSMIYVENLVDALILASTHPKAAGQTYLVSDGVASSTPQLIKDIALAMRKPSRVFPFPLSILRLCALLLGKSSAIDRLTQSLEIDTSKISKDLEWVPPYTMQQGLRATVEWYRGLS